MEHKISIWLSLAYSGGHCGKCGGSGPWPGLWRIQMCFNLIKVWGIECVGAGESSCMKRARNQREERSRARTGPPLLPQSSLPQFSYYILINYRAQCCSTEGCSEPRSDPSWPSSELASQKKPQPLSTTRLILELILDTK